MGERGPKPRPVEALRLIGSSEQYRRRNEVAIIDGEPVMPDWMPERGVPHWQFWTEHLRAQGIASAAWYHSLARWCVAIAEWEQLELLCIGALADGAIFDDDGQPLPCFALRDKAFARCDQLGKQFGHTPSSKTSIRKSEGTGLPKNRKGYIKRA